MTVAIFKNRLPVTSGSIRNGALELLDPENGGLAVETALLSCPEAEIWVFLYNGRHLGFPTSGYIGVAVGMLSLSGLEAEIPWG